MLGYYNYTVVLTYMGMLTAFTGILMACNGNINGALVCLMLSGVCDLFDGPIARTRERAAEEKRFGIQIDSLSDLIGFGVLPGIILYRMAEKSLVGSMVSAVYVLCALIRLAYFNVMEEEDQNRDETGAKIYTGLPVTSAALIFPAVLLIHMLIRADLTFLYFGVMLITGGLFISKIQIKKPQNKGIATMIFFGAVECVVLIFALKFLKK